LATQDTFFHVTSKGFFYFYLKFRKKIIKPQLVSGQARALARGIGAWANIFGSSREATKFPSPPCLISSLDFPQISVFLFLLVQTPTAAAQESAPRRCRGAAAQVSAPPRHNTPWHLCGAAAQGGQAPRRGGV